jgi:hypothetical protein
MYVALRVQTAITQTHVLPSTPAYGIVACGWAIVHQTASAINQPGVWSLYSGMANWHVGAHAAQRGAKGEGREQRAVVSSIVKDDNTAPPG